MTASHATLVSSRRKLFEEVERTALKPLPATPYEFSEWRQRTVGMDYHFDIDRHYYSVPHGLLKEKVWARITERTIEIFHVGQRVASHVRTSSNRRHTTVMEHMPANHQFYAAWSPEKLNGMAEKVGPNAVTLVEVIMREASIQPWAFAPASAFSISSKLIGQRRSMPPVNVHWSSTPEPIPRSNRS